MLVPAERTALTTEQVRNYVQQVLPNASIDTIALLMAQIAQETGKFTNLWNHNFGNITTDGSWPDGYFQLRHHDPSENVQKYRNYTSFEAGIQDLVKLLRTRYITAYNALLLGDADVFVRSLKASGYFTGATDVYLKNVNIFMREFGGTPRAGPLPVIPPLLPSLHSAVLPTLRYGMRGEVVRVWQHLLSCPVDGYFGTHTKLSTQAFQRKHSLNDDGIVGPLTWAEARL